MAIAPRCLQLSTPILPVTTFCRVFFLQRSHQSPPSLPSSLSHLPASHIRLALVQSALYRQPDLRWNLSSPLPAGTLLQPPCAFCVGFNLSLGAPDPASLSLTCHLFCPPPRAQPLPCFSLSYRQAPTQPRQLLLTSLPPVT